MQDIVDKTKELLKKRVVKAAITGLVAGFAAVKLYQYTKLKRFDSIFICNAKDVADIRNHLQTIRKSKILNDKEQRILNPTILTFKEAFDLLKSGNFKFVSNTTKHNLNLTLLLNELESSPILERPNILYSEWTTSTQKILKDYFDEFNKEILYTCDFQTDGESFPDKVSLEKPWDSHLTSMLTSLTRVIKSVNIVCVQNLMTMSLARTIHELTGVEAKIKYPYDIVVEKTKIGVVVCRSAGSMIPSKARVILGFGINIEDEPKTSSLSNWVDTKKISKEVLMIKTLALFEKMANYLDDNGWDNALASEFNAYFMLHQNQYTLKRRDQQEIQVKADTILPSGELLVISVDDQTEIKLKPTDYEFDLPTTSLKKTASKKSKM